MSHGSSAVLLLAIFPVSISRHDPSEDLEGDEAPAIGDLSETLKQARARASKNPETRVHDILSYTTKVL